MKNCYPLLTKNKEILFHETSDFEKLRGFVKNFKISRQFDPIFSKKNPFYFFIDAL